MAIQIAKKPLNFWQIISMSFKLYRADFPALFLLGILLSATAFVPRFIALLVDNDIFAGLPTWSFHKGWLVLIDLVCLIFFTAMLWRMQDVLKNIKESFLDDFKTAIRKLPQILLAVIIQTALAIIISLTIAVFFHFLHGSSENLQPNSTTVLLTLFVFIFHTCIILYIFTLFIFYLPLIVTEERTAWEAIKRSAYLVWHFWWRTFILQLTPWVFYAVFLIVLRNIFNLSIHIYLMPSQTPPTFIGVFIQFISFALFCPLFAAILLTQLHDLELRKKVL